MNFHAQAIPDVKLVEMKVFGDARGWFSESFRESDWTSLLGADRFIQDNQSFSAAPFTLRGIHFQRAPAAQAKLIQVLRGEIFDVAVDLRRRSPTFGRWVSATLKAGDGHQLLIPIGFGHAFLTLVPDTLIQYKVTAPYRPDLEGGLMWNDPALAIAWPAISGPRVLSQRDAVWQPLSATVELF